MAFTAVAAAVAASAYVSYQGAKKQAAATENAANQARATAEQQAQAADQANNKANQKRANVAGIMDAATLSGRAGVGGTMLTGPAGVDPNVLQLGKNTLLGS